MGVLSFGYGGREGGLPTSSGHAGMHCLLPAAALAGRQAPEAQVGVAQPGLAWDMLSCVCRPSPLHSIREEPDAQAHLEPFP